jgi:hypothetical protein
LIHRHADTTRTLVLILLLAAVPAAAQEAAPTPGELPRQGETSGLRLSLAIPSAEFLTLQPAKPAAAPAPERRRRPSMVGYIEDATVGPQIRLRFDTAAGNNVPDRAEFFYAKCGCYQLDPPPFFDPDAPGPGPGVPTELNFQQFYVFAEAAAGNRFSLFGELPVRAIQPQGFLDFGPAYAPFPDESGIGDLKFGAKAALAADENRGVTFQVRMSAPTGDSGKGLGTNNWSVEPALLFHQNLGERAGLEGQVGTWLPLEGSNGVDSPDKFSGNVLFYGLGTSFDVVRTDRVRFAPVVELVGWRVLKGFQTDCGGAACVFDAKGVNIVNLKVGARTTITDRNSFYVGFGWGLTDAVWYDNIFRLEYRYAF